MMKSGAVNTDRNMTCPVMNTRSMAELSIEYKAIDTKESALSTDSASQHTFWQTTVETDVTWHLICATI